MLSREIIVRPQNHWK